MVMPVSILNLICNDLRKGQWAILTEGLFIWSLCRRKRPITSFIACFLIYK